MKYKYCPLHKVLPLIVVPGVLKRILEPEKNREVNFISLF